MHNLQPSLAPLPNYELMREAFTIIGGIPEEAIKLEKVVTAKGESLDCGTIACAAGWLAMHPKFQALGLGLAPRDERYHPWQVTYKGEFQSDMSSGAIRKILGLQRHEASRLFDTRYEKMDGRSDKAVWLERMYRFLEEHGQTTAQLEAKARRDAKPVPETNPAQ